MVARTRDSDRRALNDGDAALAYKLAADHKQESGYGFAEAEWVSGWIALRHLDVPDVALDHFVRMYQGVKFPVSRARGAYWPVGRCPIWARTTRPGPGMRGPPGT